MSSIFTIVAQGQNSLWQARGSQRAKEILDQNTTLEQKLTNAGIELNIDEEAQAKSAQSLAALEQARRVDNPKAAAQERLERTEQRIKEIRQEMRMAQASGDREKIAKLAQEAAKLAREIGKAASDFSTGLANETEMAKDGSSATAASADSTAATTDGTATQPATDATAATATATAVTETAPSPQTSAPTVATTDADGAQTASAADGTGQTAASTTANGGTTTFSALTTMISDTKGELSRWKEADEFSRRSDLVLNQIRSVVKDAKRSNDQDENIVRRQTRRRALEQGDKDISEAQDAVNEVRGAASPSSSALAEGLSAALMGAIEGSQMQVVVVSVGSTATKGSAGVNLLA